MNWRKVGIVASEIGWLIWGVIGAALLLLALYALSEFLYGA